MPLLAYIATGIAAFCVPLLHIGIVRLSRNPHLMTPLAFIAFALSLVIWITVFLTLNGNIGKPEEWIAGIALLGFLQLGYLEVIFNVYRGFSFSIITDIVGNQRMKLDDILTGFAEGAGMEEMFARRIRTMKRIGILKTEGKRLSLTTRGVLIGKVGLLFNTILKIDCIG